MSDETQKMEVVKSGSETVISLVYFAFTIATAYYILDPDGFERAVQRARSLWGKCLHRVSVWQAADAIRSLPETDSDET